MDTAIQEKSSSSFRSLPPWFKQEIPDFKKVNGMKSSFRGSRLHTVCESALCPNLGKCWGQGVATFMILGDTCTRACRFCAIKGGVPNVVDQEEPYHVALAVKELNLRYVVVTSVARDDLKDEGAGQFAKTIKAIHQLMPKTKVEVLIPDFSNRLDCLKTVLEAGLDVIGHNIETVRRLSPGVRPQADYQRSLGVLRTIKHLNGSVIVKSGMMVGLGEAHHEVMETMKDLVQYGCDIFTIGQYLAPTKLKRHLRVERFITPNEFDFYRKAGEALGLKHVMSGPLVRSSFLAEEGYSACFKKCREGAGQKSL